MRKINFENIFIFEMANNHQGDLEHGLNIIRELGKITKEYGIHAAVKFQLRDLDTFIHPEFINDKDIKHISRFISTRISLNDYDAMFEETRRHNMLVMCTPFDEESVRRIIEMGVDIIKIGSCSAKDWPLLDTVAASRFPTVISTGGLNLQEIDRLVSYFDASNSQYALMHCVAIYPTPDERLSLNRIVELKQRYPHVPIGFSTHEDPDNFVPVGLAYAKGAQLFERHVGLETEKHKLNAYSSRPDQIRRWIEAYQAAVRCCGSMYRSPAPQKETESLRTLMRGVYAARDLKKGEKVDQGDVFFAMPIFEDQLASGEWHDGIICDRDYKSNEGLSNKLAHLEKTEEETIFDIWLQVKGMLNEAKVSTGDLGSFEISHHYGLKRFREFGCVIIDCINRSYCKKIIVILPRQKHPYHYHKRKEETFQLLHGDAEIEINGHRTKLELGGTVTIKPHDWHKFHTLEGAIIEEVSTTHYNDDSYYEDPAISRLPREKRKTVIPKQGAYFKNYDMSTEAESYCL